MQRPALAAVLFLLTVGLTSCARDPRQIKVTEQNKDKLVDSIKDEKGLTVDELRLLVARELRANAPALLGQTAESLVGKTIGQLIEEQRRFELDEKVREAEQARLAAEAKAKEDARVAELRETITLTVYEKTFVPANAYASRYSSYTVFRVAYQNTAKKEIRAFRGLVRFTDLFGTLIFQTPLTISTPIKAGEKATWTGQLEYNQFVAEHVRLMSTELKDMKVEWVPVSVLFADGTQIGEINEPTK
jgi:hypothetical protein